MPKVALADTFLDWSKLLSAGAGYADTVPGLKHRLEALKEIDREARELEMRRQQLQAERQAATQDLRELRQRGQQMAFEIRAVVKASFGHRDEELPAFNVRPRRSKHPDLSGRTLLPPPTDSDPDSNEGQ